MRITIPRGILIAALLWIQTSRGIAQILFINPSIENPGCANCNNCAAPGWTNCALTPDVQPGEWGVNTAAQAGCNYAGFCDGEYIGQQLNCTLVQGKTYSFTLWLAYDADYCSATLNGLCADPGSRGFPGNLEIWGGTASCAPAQLMWQSNVLTGPSDTWKQYTVTFTPNANYDHVLFKNDVMNSNVLVDNISSVIPIPSTVTVNQNVLCYGDSTGSATISASGSPSFNFSWSNGFVQNGVLVSTNSGLTAGTHTVTITDPNDPCAGPMTATVTITQPPAMNITTSSTQANCGVSNGTASVVASGGAQPLTYQWSNGQTTTTATGLAAGIYTVTITDGGGCAQIKTVQVNNVNGPVTTMSQTNILCGGQCTGSAVASVTGGTLPYTYQWCNGQITSAVSNLCAGTCTFLVTDGSGCTDFQSVTITAPSLLTASISSTPEACGKSDGTASAAVSGGTGTYTYSWNTSPVQNTSTATGLAASSYSVTITDANGCSTVQTVTVGSLAGPIIALSQTNVTCNGQCNGTAVANATGGTTPYSYLWIVGSTNASISNLCPGSYPVVVTDASGCTHSQTVTITEPAAITVNTTATPASCTASNGTASATASGGTGTLSYAWNTNPIQLTSAATGLSATTYIVFVTDANGCVQSDTITVPSLNGFTSSISHTNVLCNGGSTGSATVSVNGGSNPYSYNWTGGQLAATANGLSAGNYTCTITDGNGCTSTQTVAVTEPPALVPSAASTNANCGHSDGAANASASGGTGSYTYMWSNSQPGPSATGLVAGTYSVFVIDANGCSQTATTAVGTNPGAAASAGADVTIASGAIANLSATGSVSYSWSPSAGLSCTTCANPVASPQQTTQYCVSATDSNGCTSSDCMTVTVEAPCPDNAAIDLPTAFTPNGDGHNDVFEIAGLNNCVEHYSLIIFNRWGEKIFEGKDLDAAWDGTSHGKALDAAVFVYYFSAVFTNNQSINKKGNISLIR